MLRSMFSAISGLRPTRPRWTSSATTSPTSTPSASRAAPTVFQDTLSQVLRNGRRPDGRPRRHQPGPGRPRRQGRRDHHQLQPGRDADHRPLDRLHDQRRRLLRDPRRQPSSSTPAPARSTSTAPAGWSPRTAAILQGWMADATASVNTNGPIGDLSVPYGQIVARRRRRPATSTGNLPADAGHRHAGPDAGHDVRPARASRRRSATTSPRPARRTAGRSTSSDAANGTDAWSPAVRPSTLQRRRRCSPTPAARGTLAPVHPAGATFPAGPGRSPST